jgi:hypothetical protein
MSLCVRRRFPSCRSLASLGMTCVALVLAVSVAAAAQEPRRLIQPDSIPVELAGALISAGGFGGEPQILVGAFPGWMNARVHVPTGARVLGSAFLGTITVAVMAVPQEPAAAIEQLRPELEKLGWAAPPPPPSYGGGFRNQLPTMMGNVTVTTVFTLCGGDQQMLIARASRLHGGTQVLYRITPASTGSTCHPPQLPPNAMRSLYPTLYNPAGAGDYVSMRDCQLDGSSMGTSTQLRTPMSPQQILDHYAKQMQDSGWRPATTAIGRIWTKPDSTGAPQEASLVVTTSARDSTCHDVSMQIRGARKP